jgi:hypothetical protein
MKKLLYPAMVILFGLFSFTLIFFLLQLSGDLNPLTKFDNKNAVNSRSEEFDQSLSRLNTLDKLEDYCDSLYNVQITSGGEGQYEEKFTNIVSSVIRNRFYHGYSYYGANSNYLALLFSKVSKDGYSAIVIPNDILKHSFAACSQQSIVMMEVLKAKGFKTRKISFNGKKSGGHFCFEVFYNQSWHFYDPNMEPDVDVLSSYNRPGIVFLANHSDILTKAYKQYPQEEILDIFPTYAYGAVNVFPAPRAIAFQRATKFLSNTLWFFFLIAFLLVRRTYKRLTSKKYVWNSRIYFPQSETGAASSHYPGFAAQGS